MKDITWKEFKKVVESAGVKDEDEISYIDIGNMSSKKNISFDSTNRYPVPPAVTKWGIWS